MTTAAPPTAPLNLSGRHRRTYEAIFRHPAAHNLEWHDVRSLLNAMCEVVDEHNGNIRARLGGELLTIHAPKHKDVATIEDLMAIRCFLEKFASPASPPPVAPRKDVLVLIDHRESKIYRAEMAGSVSLELVPYDPHGFGKHLHSQAEETDGKRKPERKSYYEAVAETLRSAERILIMGCGTGESSAMEQLVADLKRDHADVAGRIVGTLAIDGHHQTEGQSLAQARAFFASLDTPT